MPSLTATSATLDPDTIDDILYLARTNSLADLQADLASLAAQRASTPAALCAAAVDPATRNTPAHLAAANGHAEVLAFLHSLDATGALATAVNDAGSTPLHYAAVNARIGAVRALVEGLPRDGPAREEYARVRNGAGRAAAEEAESAGREGWEEVVGYLLALVDGGAAAAEEEGKATVEEKDADPDEVAEEVGEMDVKTG